MLVIFCHVHILHDIAESEHEIYGDVYYVINATILANCFYF
jgi:hypothetical protein